MANQDFVEDDYLSLNLYKGHTPDDDGFARFDHEGEYYFAYYEEGDLVLRSEGYTTEPSRENGIESVKKNAQDGNQYVAKEQEDGKWVLSLKAKNHQEIARSSRVGSEAAAKAFLPAARKEALAAKKAAVAAALAAASTREVDEYLSCAHYEGKPKSDNYDGFSVFEQDGKHYFAMLKNDGSVALRSQGYQSIAARDNGIESVIKNRGEEGRYSIVEERGKHYVSLKAGNHQEIGRSCPYGSKSDAEAFLAPAAKSMPPRIVDEYLSCQSYEGKPKSSEHAGFSVFEQDSEHYFAMLKRDGTVALRSQGYQSIAARDNGIESVIKNRGEDGRYSIVEEDGKHYVSLKAGNHQEIGRSCAYASRAAAEAFLAPPAKEMPPRIVDEYLSCVSYENKPKSDQYKGFTVFEQNGEHYFAMLKDDGKVALRSQGYQSTAARDNGIESVIKNREVEGRYSILDKSDRYYVVLKAGNHQEIGRSCRYDTKAAAEAFLAPPVKEIASGGMDRIDDDYLHCDEYKNKPVSTVHKDFSAFDHEGEYYFTMRNKDGSVALRSERYQSASARDNGIQSVLKNREIDGRYSVDELGGKYYVVLKAGNHQEIGRSCPYASESAAAGWIAAPIAGVAAAALAATKVSAPKVEEKKPELEKAKVEEKKAEPEAPKVEEKVEAPKESLGAAAMGAVAIGGAALAGGGDKKKPEPAKVEGKKESPKPAPKKAKKKAKVEDDYLVCSRYEGHKVTDKANNAALFQHENGLFYFVIYDHNGHVRWRSEGFDSSAERHEELMLVFKHKKDKKRRTKQERKGLHYEILKAPNGREIARSCLKKKGAVAPVAAAGAGAAAAAVGAAALAGAAATAPAAKAKAAPVAAAAAGSGSWFKWWYLLPLALIPILFFLLRGCSGDNTAAVIPAKKEAAKVETPAKAAETNAAQLAAAEKAAADKVAADKSAAEKAAAAAAAAAAVSCNCNGLRHPVFNVPSGRAPKALTKLGTFPEFGNSHALDPAGFYNKLKSRAASNGVDKRFLDGISKAMGYNSFADLKPNMFTNAKIPRGTSGNIGSGPNHKTVHRTLNTSARDLEAFKIKAANGCDLHFMKTCGNHFFFCPK